MSSEVFDILNSLNVNEHTETKKSGGQALTYLSWTWAWAEVKKRYPAAKYTIWRDANGLPYVFDPNTGYMVSTSVTIEAVTHDMWLPVMDGANKAMKAEPYEYSTKFNGKKRVEAASMMDINKAIMRCLTKNLAMFGLGLYIYAGEDLPEEPDDADSAKKAEKPAKKAEEKKTPEENGPTKCEMCGEDIVGVEGKANTWITEAQLIDYGMKKFKKKLCAPCQRLLAMDTQTKKAAQ